jgi:CheY-like chemotaxis protein
MPSFFDSLRSSPTEGDQNGRFRVLIAEDHLDIARIMTWLLSRCGFDVQAVHSGQQVYPTALAFRPHFLLLDIGLPGLDGYQVAKLIRDDSNLSNVVIIAISAYGPNTHPERSCQAGFDFHLTKPVKFDDLLPLLVPRRD